VLEGVGERLLDDAVGRVVEDGRKRSRRSLDAHLDRQPGGAHLLGEAVESCQARHRRARLVGAKAADHPAQLGQRLAPRSFRGLERRALLLLSGQQEPPDGACLEHDHPQPVADDVVQLARDPLALELDRQGGAALLLGGQLGRDPLETARVLALAARHAAREVRPPMTARRRRRCSGRPR
jgi:hypothetical protein